MTDSHAQLLGIGILAFGSMFMYGVTYNYERICNYFIRRWLGHQITKMKRKRHAMLIQRRAERNVARQARKLEAVTTHLEPEHFNTEEPCVASGEHCN